MAGITIEIRADNTAEVINRLKAAKHRGLVAIGMAAEGNAKKELYPGHGLDTGRLRNSITNSVYEDAAYIGTDVEYAIWVEAGARGRAGIHFLQSAATGHGAEYAGLLRDSLENA